MPMQRTDPRGFTLVELMVTITVLGLLLAFSVPAFNALNQTHQLKASSQNVAGTFRLYRERAMASGVAQVVHFNTVYGGNWHVHSGATIISNAAWKFPTGIDYYTVTANPTFEADGRVSSGSGVVVLKNQKDVRDTITVLSSGLVLAQ
jgi:type IV fimbrial biogenesis protein FimT